MSFLRRVSISIDVAAVIVFQEWYRSGERDGRLYHGDVSIILIYRFDSRVTGRKYLYVIESNAEKDEERTSQFYRCLLVCFVFRSHGHHPPAPNILPEQH